MGAPVVGAFLPKLLTGEQSLSSIPTLGVLAAGIILTFMYAQWQVRSGEESPEAIKEQADQLHSELRSQVKSRPYGARSNLIAAPLKELDLDTTPCVGWVRRSRPGTISRFLLRVEYLCWNKEGDFGGDLARWERPMNAYPIKLTAHVRAYAFGERLIPEKLGKSGLPEGIVAETWEISDYRETSGQVVNGEYAGRTLHNLVLEFPDELVGEGWRGPHFPLLEKFIDASNMLPVHLHADDETAQRVHGEPHGKTEAWHILWAAQDATILAGIKEGASREELREAFEALNHDAVIPRHPVRAGDTVYVPGGVIHSFGPDTLVFEVQQTSDLGQFVTPEGLYGEPLDKETWEANIEAALDELRIDYRPHPNPGLALEGGPNRRILCCAGPYFALERWTLAEAHVEPIHPGRCLTLSNVGDRACLEYAGGVEGLGRGESCVLPASIGEVEILPEGEASLIVCYVPDLERDVVARLRAAGYPDEEIRNLGEIHV